VVCTKVARIFLSVPARGLVATTFCPDVENWDLYQVDDVALPRGKTSFPCRQAL